MNHKVSVIIPTYNDTKYIKNSIESVLSQSFKDFEIIVIDDGSTDNTKSILNSYIESKKIFYLFQENKGQTIARNNGILVAKGLYVAFIDSDDEWIDKDKLKKQVDFLDYNPDYVLVGTAGVVVNENKNKIIDYVVPDTDYKIKQNILFKNPFILSSILVRKNMLNKAGLFISREYINAEDYNLWLRIGLLGKFCNITDPMTMYMMREGNISSNNKIKILKSNILFIKDFKNKYPNYIKSLIFAYLKFFLFSILGKNKKIQKMIAGFMYRKYRKF